MSENVLDASIILAGRQPDLVNAFAQGQQARAFSDEMQNRNALRNVYQTQGAGILAGDPNALNALARHDPQQALAIQGQHQIQAQRSQVQARLSEQERRAAEAHVAKMDAAERAAKAERIQMGLKAAYGAQSPEEWDAIATQFGSPDLVGEFENRDAHVRRHMEFAEILKADQPEKQTFDNFRVVGNQLYDLSTEGGPSVVGRSQQTPGFSVTTSDGTVVQHGWQGNTPPGQNPDVTGTPRNPGQLGKELSKKDAAALEEINAAGRTATDLESLATQLETVSPKVGYTGPGGEAYGFIDDIVGFLPGDSGSRGAFKSLAMEAQLTFTEKTKGAITDREMGMFRAAVPNLSQTPEGNAAISQVMKAGAARSQSRAGFFENWARKHGSLEGAQEVWSDYMRDNPLIAEDGNGIKANPEGDWQSYLNRQPAMSYTPENIMQMDAAALAQIPIEKLTGPQLDALERRFQEMSQ